MACGPTNRCRSERPHNWEGTRGCKFVPYFAARVQQIGNEGLTESPHPRMAGNPAGTLTSWLVPAGVCTRKLPSAWRVTMICAMLPQ